MSEANHINKSNESKFSRDPQDNRESSSEPQENLVLLPNRLLDRVNISCYASLESPVPVWRTTIIKAPSHPYSIQRILLQEFRHFLRHQCNEIDLRSR
jgi:hypothetical protein